MQPTATCTFLPKAARHRTATPAPGGACQLTPSSGPDGRAPKEAVGPQVHRDPRQFMPRRGPASPGPPGIPGADRIADAKVATKAASGFRTEGSIGADGIGRGPQAVDARADTARGLHGKLQIRILAGEPMRDQPGP